MPSAATKSATRLQRSADPAAALQLLDTIQADIDRLRGLLQPQLKPFDPADPRNKTCDGKLTEHGVECCYRLFDEGKSRYSVAQQMKISFAAATHRFATWAKAGGEKRKPMRQPMRQG